MPEYVDAPSEVLELARKIILEHPEADFAKARINYMMKPMKKSTWAARCYLAHGPWAHLLPHYDYAIVIWQEYWNTNEDHREPLLYHELCHVLKSEKDRWVLRKHVIQEFPEVIKRYGCWSPQLECLIPRIKRPYQEEHHVKP